MVEHIDRDELRAKIDRGDPFVLLGVLAPRYYPHSDLPGALTFRPARPPRWRRTCYPTRRPR